MTTASMGNSGDSPTPSAPAAPAVLSAPAPARAVAARPVARPVVPLLTPTAIMLAVVLLGAFLSVFAMFFYAQHIHSWGNEDWMHSYFIPLISAYLLWQSREQLAAEKPVFFLPGLLPLVMGIVFYVFFLVGYPNHMGQGWSMLLSLLGIVMLTCGPRIARIAIIPIGYLALGVTVSQMIMIQVTSHLQTIAAAGSEVVLALVGVDVYREGNVLTVSTPKFGEVPLNVAEACAGMRTVIGFLALGVAVALIGARHWWQRTALVMLAVPVALLMNMVRVAVLGVASLYDPEFSKGTAHMLIGTLLLIPAFFLFLGVVWLLNALVVEGDAAPGTTKASKDKSGKAAAAPAKPAPTGPRVVAVGGGRVQWSALRRPGVVVAGLVLLVCGSTIQGALRYGGLHLRKDPVHADNYRQVSAIPSAVTGWKQVGPDQVASNEVLEELGTRNYLTRAYTGRDAAGRQRTLFLHLTYYTGMVDTVPHVPERCMTGSGSSLVPEGSRTVPLFTPEQRAALADRWKLVASTPEGETKLAGVSAATRSLWDEELYWAPWRVEPAGGGSAAAEEGRAVLPRRPWDIALRVSEFRVPRNPRQSEFIGYFFIANGNHTDTANDVRKLAFKLTDKYAYFLKVQVSSHDVSSAEELAAATGSLLGELLPHIMRTVPDWVEVEAGRWPWVGARAPE